MKLVKLYESLILEGQLEACVAQFGQELFSPEFGGEEDNTELEDDYVELIHKFSGKISGSRIDTKMFQMATNLKKCVSAYPDILQPEGMAFKGIKISIEDLIKSYGEIKNDVQMGKPFRMVYGAKTLIQSWTNDEDIANDDFGKSGNILDKLLDKFEDAKLNGQMDDFIKHLVAHKLDTKVPVILKYRTRQEDFIFKGKFFKHLSSTDEDEILRIDNRPIEVMAKFYPIEFSARLFDLLEVLTTWRVD
jgi:hypothetical protein